MKTQVEVKDRSTGIMVEITLSNGKLFRFRAEDGQEEISITSIDGAVLIIPKATNQILIKADEQ